MTTIALHDVLDVEQVFPRYQGMINGAHSRMAISPTPAVRPAPVKTAEAAPPPPPPPPQPKPYPAVALPPPVPEFWACSQCTYHNAWVRVVCELCEMQQPPATALLKVQAARPPPPPPPPPRAVAVAPMNPPVPPPVTSSLTPARQGIPLVDPALAPPSEPGGASSKKEVVVGLAFNISATVGDFGDGAPPLLLQSLHAFFTQGFLLHPSTGTVALLDENVKHVVFVELPALDSWPAVEECTVAQHPFLINGLPALNVARTDVFAVHNKSVPFYVDATVREVSLVVRALLGSRDRSTCSARSQTAVSAMQAVSSLTLAEALSPVTVTMDDVSLTKVNPKTRRPYSQEEVDESIAAVRKAAWEALDELWALPACRGIPRSKLARRRFISLLHDRITFLKDMKRYIMMSNWSQQPDGASGDGKLLRAAKLIGPSFIGRLALIMLAEAINLSDESMRRDWGNSRRELIWTARDRTRVMKGRQEVGLSLVCLYDGLTSEDVVVATQALSELRLLEHYADKPLNDARGLLAGLGAFTMLKADFEPRGDAVPVVSLRDNLAPAFGLSDPRRLHRILSASRYVMSNDFAIKLLLLNERRRVGAPVILCGDTGKSMEHIFMCTPSFILFKSL